MIQCIFTIDYEIYGNGEGSLRDLVYEPARKLKELFDAAGTKLVVFVDAAELEMIAAAGSDPALCGVERQVLEFYEQGYEIALHIHPQWCNAQYTSGRWILDDSEYNLCLLRPARIEEIVDRSIDYLRRVVGNPAFVPLAFRAGNWLFQPAKAAAKVLSARGVKLDSSVFKGGLQHRHNLDYRRALKNGAYWNFSDDVTIPDAAGALLEIPIYTKMVPFWRMATGKRIALQNRSSVGNGRVRRALHRANDMMRLFHPLKFDFCRMTYEELVWIIDRAMDEDRRSGSAVTPVVAIGHTKDLTDLATVRKFLDYLKDREIQISTFADVYDRCVAVRAVASPHVFDPGQQAVQTEN